MRYVITKLLLEDIFVRAIVSRFIINKKRYLYLMFFNIKNNDDFESGNIFFKYAAALVALNL